MTICIAAICEAGDAILTVGDGEVGIGITAGELGRTKWDAFAKDWHIGIAGNVANATDVIEWSRKLRPSVSEPIDSMQVRAELEKSYRGARLARAEAEFLASRGWTLQDFVDHGRAKLPEATYANIDARIALFDFNADLIVCGWGPGESFPSILTVRNPGVCVEHMRLGFWCIGSGSTAAQMSLFGRNYSPDMPLEEALYYVVEAKINAEHATGVGRRTDTFIAWQGRDPDALSEADNDALRQIWEQLKPRDFNEGHCKIVETIGEVKKYKTHKQST